MSAVITLSHVDKRMPLRRARGQSVKNAMLALFRKRVSEQFVSAARDVSLSVERGEALGIIGANGAGKTTLLRLIAGITPPTHGEVRAEGRVLPLLELGAGFHPELSGYENIFLQGVMLGLSRARIAELVDRIVAFAELESYIHMPVRHYSSGMYVRLGFAISIHVEPDILLIDEAFSVGDIFFQQRCVQKMREFHERGGTFLLVTHDADLIQSTCERVIWIDQGRIVAEGDPATIGHEYRKHMFARSYPMPVPFVHVSQLMGQQGGRFGSGVVTVDYIDFLDGEGKACHSFENGSPMRMRATYRVRDVEKLSSMTAGTLQLDILILIHSRQGHTVALVSTRNRGQSPCLDARGGQLFFEVPRLDLAPGNYQAAFFFYSGPRRTLTELHDLHSRTYSFSVAPNPCLSEIAGLDVPCEWEFERC